MSTAGIRFGGLASGLDTQAIISALVAIERRPIQQLETKKTGLNKAKSLFGDLDGLLDKLSDAAKALKQTTDFLAMKAASDDEDVLLANASSSASPGTHRVKVLQLASAQVNSSTGSPDATSTTFGDGVIQIDVGGDTHLIPIVNEPGNQSTLTNIASAINAEGIGVRAEVVDTGNTASGGANRYQLVVRSTETGVENDFTLSFDSGDTALENLVNDVNANERAAAADAHVLVNGIDVYRSTNTIANAIAGVTLELKAADPVVATSPEITVTVSTDAEETSKKVKDFVEAYNKVVDFFGEQNALDAEGKAKSPLFGDVTLRGIRSGLRGIVGGQVTTTGNNAYALLSQIGITSDTAGKLTFNQSKFEAALADDEQAVARIFTDATNGIAGRIETQLDTYTDSVDGLIKARRDGFDRLVKQTQDRIERGERRITQYEKQLETRYANLESLLTRLQGQGTSLGGIQSIAR